MFFQDLEPLPASAGPMKYALSEISLFTPEDYFGVIFDFFLKLLATPNRYKSALGGSFESFCFFIDFWTSFFFWLFCECWVPKGVPGIPKIWLPTSFFVILVHLEPLQGPDACLELIFIDLLWFFDCFFLVIVDGILDRIRCFFAICFVYMFWVFDACVR